jgi:antirestriction protein ArdC
MTLTEMQRHIASLCEATEILVSYGAQKAWGSYQLREIYVPHVKSARSYATALHEIGHILGRHQTSEVVLVRERWAWEWARRNAIEWTSVMQRHSEWCLEYYKRTPRARIGNSLSIESAE